MQQEWFRGDTNQCNAIKEETLLGIFIGLAVIAFVIVILIIVNLIVLLKRTKIAKSQKKVGIKSIPIYLYRKSKLQYTYLLTYLFFFDEMIVLRLNAKKLTWFLPILKNFPSSTSSSTGIATLQKRLFGRKNSQEDPLPVVLLSYKADYDETLPIQGIKIAISSNKIDDFITI